MISSKRALLQFAILTAALLGSIYYTVLDPSALAPTDAQLTHPKPPSQHDSSRSHHVPRGHVKHPEAPRVKHPQTALKEAPKPHTPSGTDAGRSAHRAGPEHAQPRPRGATEGHEEKGGRGRGEGGEEEEPEEGEKEHVVGMHHVKPTMEQALEKFVQQGVGGCGSGWCLVCGLKARGGGEDGWVAGDKAKQSLCT